MGGWVAGRVAGWPGSDNMTISVQLNLTGTGTGTELGKILLPFPSTESVQVHHGHCNTLELNEYLVLRNFLHSKCRHGLSVHLQYGLLVRLLP